MSRPATASVSASGERRLRWSSLVVGCTVGLLAVTQSVHPSVGAGATMADGFAVGDTLRLLAAAGPLGLLAATSGSDVGDLIDAVERIAAGDYDVDVDVDRDDDLGELADAIDEMAEQVEARETKLRGKIDYTDEVLDAIDDVFYVLDREGEHRQWNQTLADVSGYDHEEIAELHPLDYFEGEDRKRITARIDEAFETGHARAEAALQTKSGEAIPYEWIANRLSAPDGTPVVAGVGRDVSVRKERERELRAARDHLEATNDALQRLYEIGADRDATIEEKIVAMLDLGREHLGLSGGFLSRIDPESDRFAFEHTVGLPDLDPGEVAPFSETFCRETVTRTGVLALHDASNQGWAADPAYDRWGIEQYLGGRVYVEGELRGTVAFVDDERGDAPFSDEERTFVDLVTQVIGYELERQRKARRLEEHTQFTDAILDSMDDIFYVVGPDFSVQRWNRSMCEATGYTDDEIDDMHPTEFVVDEDQERIADAVAETFETGSARTEARVATKDGDAIPYEFIGSRVEAPDGNPVLIGVGRDVTERVERERELQRTRYLLRQAQEIAHVGGWELDVRAEPHTFEATDEFYEIQGIPAGEPITPEEIIEHYHPEDREHVERLLTDAIEDGVGYDMEVRLAPTGVGDRWIRSIAEPVLEDGEVVALRGSLQDITDRKENELRLQALHDVARGLLEAESRSAIADLVLDAAVTVLGPPCVAVYLFDEESGNLEPAAISEHFEEICRNPAAGYDAATGELLWEAYVDGEATVADDEALDDTNVVTNAARSALLVPIGEHGVLLVASDQADVAAEDRRLAETLVAAMEAALSQLESDVALRANQQQLEAQNRRLRRQIQITEIIRRVDRSLVGASTREEIESAVCERLAESDDVVFAWIGALDEAARSLEPRVWAGEGHEYLDAVSLSADAAAPDPALRAAVDGESVVVRSVVEAVTSEEWRKHALVWEFSSVIAVPLELEEYSYGVLAVYASDAGAFGDLERNVFEELGESIANAINAVEARRALYADEFVELRLRLAGEEEFLGRVADATGATVEYVGLATHADDESRLFFEVDDAEPAAVRNVLEELHAVKQYRQIGEVNGGRTLFEATVAGTVLAARLVEHGGVPRSMVADDGELEVVVDVPTATDVREFVEMLRERYPTVELLARQDVTRDVQTRQELVAGLFDGLTDRQLEVLRTAFFAGFFEWPRESTGEEVAELLGVSQPTVNRHLRHGLARLLEQLFEEEPTAVAPS